LQLDDLDPNLTTTNGNITTTNGNITATNGDITGNTLESGSSLILPDANGRVQWGLTAPIATFQQVSGSGNNNIVLTTKNTTDAFAVKCGVAGSVDTFRFSTDGTSTDGTNSFTNVRRLTIHQPAGSTGSALGGTFQVLTNSPEDQYNQSLGIAQILAQTVNLGTDATVGNNTVVTVGNDIDDDLIINAQTTVAAGFTDIGKTGVTYGVFGKLATLNDRSDTSLNPTKVNPTLAAATGGTASDSLSASAGYVAPEYVYSREGTNGSGVAIYEIVLNGSVNKSNNWDGQGDQLIFTLPSGFRPSGRLTWRAQGRGGVSASRIDITSAGEVYFIDGGSTSTTMSDISLSGMSFYANL
jgi:hypothetical protein